MVYKNGDHRISIILFAVWNILSGKNFEKGNVVIVRHSRRATFPKFETLEKLILLTDS